MQGIFAGRTQLRYPYGRYGYTRGGGKIWHGGMDLVGSDSTDIRMPYYKNKRITGKVVRARRVTDHSNKTWEWGWYVCVQLDPGQTPDDVNYLYFCHCRELKVTAGQAVASGDLLGIKLKLTPEKLGWWGLEEENDWEFHTLADFREESWTVKLTIPEADPGRTLTTEQPLNIAGYELPVKQLYVSPISFLYDVSGLPFRGQPFDGDTVDGLMAVMGDEELTNAVLTMADGSQVTMAARYFCQISHPAEGMFDQGRVIYRLADIIDPNQVSSVTILDQKFPAAE